MTDIRIEKVYSSTPANNLFTRNQALAQKICNEETICLEGWAISCLLWIFLSRDYIGHVLRRRKSCQEVVTAHDLLGIPFFSLNLM